MYQNIEGFFTPFVPLFEVMYGIDTVSIDNDNVFHGMTTRSKKFMNTKSLRMIKDTESNYENLTHKKNVFIICIGIYPTSTHYERIEYSLMDLISNAGGFFNAMNRIFMLIVLAFCSTNINSTLIYFIFSRQSKMNACMKRNLKDITEI